MAKLIYSTIASLDGHVADAQGNFDWAAPDEEVHAFVNDLERSIGAHLYGRRTYEVMRYWESADATRDRPPVEQDYAQIWRSADKIVRCRLRRQDTDRAGLRRRSGPSDESTSEARHQRGRSRPRRPGA